MLTTPQLDSYKTTDPKQVILARFSALLRIQDGAECGNKILQNWNIFEVQIGCLSDVPLFLSQFWMVVSDTQKDCFCPGTGFGIRKCPDNLFDKFVKFRV